MKNKQELKKELLTEAGIVRNLAYQLKEYSEEQLKLLHAANVIEEVGEGVRVNE